MVAGEKKCAPRSTITPTKACSAIVYRCIRRRHHTGSGTWSLLESKLHINYLELNAVLLALKEFQDLCQNNIVLIATDNTTVVAYIYVFQAICNRWHQPQIDLFAMRFNNKLAQYVSPLLDPSLPLGDLDPYAFPPPAILGKVVEKLQDMQENHSDYSGVAQHALVLRSSGHVQSH